MIIVKQLIALLVIVTLSYQVHTEELNFEVIDNPQQHMQTEREVALKEDKKLLWVLGSEWCHDSRSLVEKLSSPELAKILTDNYRVSLIDVSYLNQGFDFTRSVGMHTFYATPTVLILNPDEMQQINAEDMHMWSHAYTVSFEDTRAYFERYALQETNSQSDWNEQQMRLLKELQGYVRAQEERIFHSYKVVGPMLEAYKKGEADENFDPYWDTLAELRMQLPKTIATNMAIIKSSSGSEDVALDLPEIAPFPWE